MRLNELAELIQSTSPNTDVVDEDHVLNILGLFTDEILNMNQVIDSDLIGYIMAAAIPVAIFKGMVF